MAYIAGAYKITELGTMDDSEFNSAKILVAAGGYSKQYPLSAVAQQAGQDPRVDELSVVIDELSGTVGDIDQTVSEQTETIENLEADFNTLSNEIDGILSGVDSLTTTTQTLSNDISSLQQEYELFELTNTSGSDRYGNWEIDGTTIQVFPKTKTRNYMTVPDSTLDSMLFVINSPNIRHPELTLDLKTSNNDLTMEIVHGSRQIYVEDGDNSFDTSTTPPSITLEANSHYLLAVSEINSSDLAFKIIKLNGVY